ncbi:MAG: hypothetical protein QNK37_10870 [Acidobacteriota bacterium]|nr:hypothetical protein [Acidobacteriota bacterium]
MTYRIALVIALAVGINVAAYMAKGDHYFAANMPPLELAVLAMETDGAARHFDVTAHEGRNGAVLRWELAQVEGGEDTLPLKAEDILSMAVNADFTLASQEGDKAVYTFQCAPVQLGEDIVIAEPFTGRMIINQKTLDVEWIKLAKTQTPNYAGK